MSFKLQDLFQILQIQKTSTFKSKQTKRTFTIFHHVNCLSKYVIYLMQRMLCNKQYVGKAETSFDITLSNHRKDVKIFWKSINPIS